MPVLIKSTKTDIRLERSNIVGRGRIATIFGGTFNGSKVAIKRILLLDVHPLLLDDSSEKCEKISALQDPNVVTIFDSYSDDNFKYFVMELCIASIFDYCCDKYQGVVPAQVDGLYQMASGLHYIHRQGLVHRNIKPENVLISSSFQLKISDVDLTKPISIEKALSLTSDGRPLSPSMQAPEIIEPINSEVQLTDEESEALHTFASDTFSLGCVFFTFLTKSHPFRPKESPKLSNVILNIIEGKSDLSELGADHFALPIIEKMIHYDATQRTNLAIVLKFLEVKSLDKSL